MRSIAQPAPAPASLLRRAIQADLAVSLPAVVATLLAAAPLSALTGIPSTTIQMIGALVFLPYTAGLIYAATRPEPTQRLGLIFMSLNFSWVAISALALILGWLPLTTAGFWVVVFQAIVVDLLAVAQFLGLRRMRS
jgi:hypothetical protein